MGTKVHYRSFLPGYYYSMRDLNDDSNTWNWPLFYGDKNSPNGQYYNDFAPRASADCSGNDKDAVKQTMLEHEAIFKNQVDELHRVYRIQRNLMDEVKRKELHKVQIPMEASMSSSPLASQFSSEGARKAHMSCLHLPNVVSAMPSVSGFEDSNSPMSSIKGSCSQAGPFPSQNGGSTLKDVEILEVRPRKVRRKIIDLQLPADECIDLDEIEELRADERVKIEPSSGKSLFIEEREKSIHRGAGLRSGLGCGNGFADLNEPIMMDETENSGYSNPLGRVLCREETQCHAVSGGTRNQFLALSKEVPLNSYSGSIGRTVDNQNLVQTGSGKGWFPQVHGAGSSQKSVSRALHLDKSPSFGSAQFLSNNLHQVQAFPLSEQSKTESGKGKTIPGLETSAMNHRLSHYNPTEICVDGGISKPPTSYPTNPSSFVEAWNPLLSQNPKYSVCQMSVSVQTHPCLNSSMTLNNSSIHLNSSVTLNNSSIQSSARNQRLFGGRWQTDSNSRANKSCTGEGSNLNGLYYGSPSGFKESSIQFPLITYESMIYTNDNKVATDNFRNQGTTNFYSHSNNLDNKSVKDVNLNVPISNSSFKKDIDTAQGLEWLNSDKRHEDNVAALPWLRAKPPCKPEIISMQRELNRVDLTVLKSSVSHLSNKYDNGNYPSRICTLDWKSDLYSNPVEASRTEKSEQPSNTKILGFPIFDKPYFCKDNPSSRTSSSVCVPHSSGREGNKGKNIMIDINVPLDPVDTIADEQTAEVMALENKKDKRVADSRHHIDLNFCLSEDEPSFTSPRPGTSTAWIDLEVPAVFDPGENDGYGIKEEDKCRKALHCQDEETPDELIRVAADAMISFGDLDEAPILDWFVETIDSCAKNLEMKLAALIEDNDGNEESSSEESDYFESVTLKLKEMQEEEFMPKPLVPESLKLEQKESTSSLSRPRRGQARRGRPRRDFQRDILPGLTSLSRHEVTEDFQTFGGIMKATGCSWNSSLTRRNGCGRGRKKSVNKNSSVAVAEATPAPLVQQLHNIEDRSLTGWGKTTRRPRRQRCPSGNLLSVPSM